MRLRNDAVQPHIRPQRLGHQNTAVGLLVVFQNRHPSAADREATAIQRMHKLRLAFAFAPEPYVRPSRLEGLDRKSVV